MMSWDYTATTAIPMSARWAHLQIRGPYAWLGYDWNSCSFGSAPAGGRHGQAFTWPSMLDSDVGEPLDGACSVLGGAASGIYERRYSRALVTFDCATWTGSVTLSSSPAAAGTASR